MKRRDQKPRSGFTRRAFLGAAAAATASALVPGIMQGCSIFRRKPDTDTGKGPPNIVLLLADDLGYRDLGCYGGPVKTPALDGLAAGGVRFTDFYAGAPTSSPSRATLLTGRHHFRTGIYDVLGYGREPMYLREREVTLPEMLQAQGYATAHFGKWHVGSLKADQSQPSPAVHGFDYWFGMNDDAHPSHRDPVNFLRNGEPVGIIKGYSCQIVVDEAISWLEEERDPERPFFLNLWFHEPHEAAAAPDGIVSLYGDLDDEAAVYAGTIDNTDRAIARLLAKLRQIDSPENTLIVYASDNGSYRADSVGNLRGNKGSVYEGGIRVPGIFYWPGNIAEGHIVGEPAGIVDLLPTICSLTRTSRPKRVHLDGADISPLLMGRGDAFERQQALYWHNGEAMAARRGDYAVIAHADFTYPKDVEAIAEVSKEIVEVLRKADSPELVPWIARKTSFYKEFTNIDAEMLRWQFIRMNTFQKSWIPALKSGTYKQFELYDLATDPGQQYDLFARLPSVAARLKEELLQITASVMDEAPG